MVQSTEIDSTKNLVVLGDMKLGFRPEKAVGSWNGNGRVRSKYNVFVLESFNGLEKLPKERFNSVCLGQCESPPASAVLVRKALRRGIIVNPQYVLLVPTAHLLKLNGASD